MRPPYKEGEFEFVLSGALTVRKHDAELREVPAVDLLVDFPGEVWFIECKDPECSSIPLARKPRELAKFVASMQSGHLVFENLIRKIQCSCNALHAYEKPPKKPYRYLVVIGYEKATAGEFSIVRDSLIRLMRKVGPAGKHWDTQFTVEVLNITRWNKRFGPTTLNRVP
jgi:hypothetical protein